MRRLTQQRGRPGGAALLVALFGDPSRAKDLSVPQWDALLRVARVEKLLSRLGAVLQTVPQTFTAGPPEVGPMFRAALAYPELVQARAAWEVHRILSATADLDVEFVLLKGAAYVQAGLPLARARAFADVDLLVREAELSGVEARLLARGWQRQTTNAYDQRYYRDWMHEIAPLRHPERQIEVDLHHRILPRTSRLAPSPGLLWEASIRVGPRLRVLAPADMVLHCATHLFYDGEVRGHFRDLLDCQQLLLHFSSLDPDFWDLLSARARDLALGRPLYYAVRFCHEILDLAVPDRVLRALHQDAPALVIDAWMGHLVRRTLPPRELGRGGARVSGWLLYVRSHWLRMPPGMLFMHLLRKGWRRLSTLGSWQSRTVDS